LRATAKARCRSSLIGETYRVPSLLYKAASGRPAGVQFLSHGGRLVVYKIAPPAFTYPNPARVKNKLQSWPSASYQRLLSGVTSISASCDWRGFRPKPTLQ
jgi:hypothetical protein